jgi:UDP-3-O-acyl N-acetylglucosamine deacetylase
VSADDSRTRSGRTLKASTDSIEGVGIHTGVLARVTLHAAEPGSGVVFVSAGRRIPARAARVSDTSRCTVLASESGGVTVSTVEHLLSALVGLGITDALVAVDGPELPIGDGSAALWVDAVRSAGTTDTGEPVVARALPEPLLVTGRGGAFVAAYPSDALRLTVAISFDHPLVGTQVARFDASRDDYGSAVAPARTFGFLEEVEALRAAGLARGGSLENAVIVYPDRYSAPLRFGDELARHKLLDLLGDLSLGTGGAPLPAMDVVAVKPSHRLNTELAARLAEGVGASGTMA